MTTMISRRAMIAGSIAAPILGAAAAHAQSPARTIQLILPVSAGSGLDAIARAAQNELGYALGGAVVVNNQAGAGGLVGTQQLVRAAPDGTTLMMFSSNHAVYPSVLKSVPFDPLEDITPIAIIGSTPFMLVTNPNKIPARTLPELTAYLKANPDKHNYGSSGNGTILHFATAMYVEQAGVKVGHVPYKGVGPLITDLIGGQIDMAVLAYPAIIGHLKSGAMRAMGVGAAKRLTAAPEIPTFVEQGMKDYLIEGWFGIAGPAKMPAAEVQRIHAAIVTAFGSQDVKSAMTKQANEVAIISPDAAREFVKAELAKYAVLAKAIKLEPQ